MGDWTLFSNYGHVLVCLARNNEARLRDVAADVGITERAVQKIVRDLQDEGYITVRKHGRRNRYRINTRKGLRHPLESHCSVGKLMSVVKKPPRKGSGITNELPVEAPDSGTDVAADDINELDFRSDSTGPEVEKELTPGSTSDPGPDQISEESEHAAEEQANGDSQDVLVPDTRQQRSLF